MTTAARTSVSRGHVPHGAPREAHYGRSFEGNRLEQECPCPLAPCGLVIDSRVHDECEQHPMKRAKTIRQFHWADECPANPATPTVRVSGS